MSLNMCAYTLFAFLLFVDLSFASILAKSNIKNDHIRPRQVTASSSASASATSTGLLYDFQVYKPLPTPTPENCDVEQTLMVYDFANSYGSPFVGNYTPPSCNFNSVYINFTATCAGVQYDRLGMMYLGDIEVWRTSTPEPTSYGIIWNYEKDMSQYLSLWKSPQTLIFDLGNIVDSTYTGIINTTLTATFFYKEDAPVKADKILPISRELGSEGEASVFSVPSENATVSQTIPLNTTRAVVSLAACGQSNEEFWYSNLLNSDVDTWESGSSDQYGPFREVQLLIDGILAGVAWPFPIVFTGGVAPGFWRPIAGIDAFDLREYEIDITPWLPYLLDGKAHTYTIQVVGIGFDSGGNGAASLSTEVLSYWDVDGKIFLYYGATHNVTSHALPSIYAPTPDIYVTSKVTQVNGTNDTLYSTVTASRSFTVSSSFGSWSQSLSYYNDDVAYDEYNAQNITQYTKGIQKSVDNFNPSFSNEVSFSYPMTMDFDYTINADDTIEIVAEMNRGLVITSSGQPDISVYTLVAGPMSLDTTQWGTAHYSSETNASYSYGDTAQKFTETSYGTTYTRYVHAVNVTIVADTEGEFGRPASRSSYMGSSAAAPLLVISETNE